MFAAASLKDALDTINANWKKESGKQAVISYAASSALAKQIEKGAPADIFVSADEDWMNYLAERKLIKPDTRFDLAGNRLVLIAPKDSKLTATIGQGLSPRLSPRRRPSRHGGHRLGPGRQIRQGCTREARRLGRGEGQDRASRECARGAVAGVARRGPARHRLRDRRQGGPQGQGARHIPESTHAPILYPIAITVSSTNADAPAFLAYLKTADAQSMFEAQGFKVLLNY